MLSRQVIYQAIQDYDLHATILYVLKYNDEQEIQNMEDKHENRYCVLNIYQENHWNDVDFQRIVVPDGADIKRQILNGCHFVP